MPDGWEVLRVLESLHSRVNALEIHAVMDAEGWHEDHDAMLLALKYPLLFELYDLFNPGHATQSSISRAQHGNWGFNDVHGDWSIDKACLQDTIWGHGEVHTNEWDFIIEPHHDHMEIIEPRHYGIEMIQPRHDDMEIIEPHYDDMEILTEKVRMISLLKTENTVQIMNDLRTLSKMQKIGGVIKNKFELLIFIPGVTKVIAEDIFVGTIEDIIGELNRLFSPEEMDED